MNFKNVFKDLIHNESGVTAIEYGIITALIILVAVGPIAIVGRRLFETFFKIWVVFLWARFRAGSG